MIETLTMPASADAERAVLGGIILKNSCYPEAAALLQPQDFSLDSHRRIFARMIELGETGKAIDYLTLANVLGAHKEIESVGGVAYLSSLPDGVAARDTLKPYIEIVRDKARRRALIQVCQTAALAAADLTEITEDCFEKIQQSLLSIEADTHKQPALHVCQFTDEVFANLERMRSHSGELIGLSTGIRSLDLITTGIREGELWVLGGRPGDGKSSIALQVATENIRRCVPVGLFTIEMSKEQVLTRIWSQESGIPFEKLRDPRRLSQVEHETLAKVSLELGQMPLYVDDSGSLTVRELVARARLMVKQQNIQLLIVDYVQLIDADGKDERQRVSRISQALRELAKEGVPVLALSQLARPKDGALNTRPNKFSLKESGSLEADAHTVLLAFRPVDKHDLPTGEDELIVAKQRNGPYSIEPVYFDSKTLVYRERELVGSNH